MQPALRHMALGRDAGAENFRQAVDVDRLDAEAGFEITPHRLAPRLRAECALSQRQACDAPARPHSPLLSALDGGGHSTAAPKSHISITWRSVPPPDIGTTVQPRRSAP